MKIFDLIKLGREKIDKVDTPQLDAEVILSHLIEKDRMYLFLNRDMEVSPEIEEEFYKLIERRKNGEPVQYITGVQEFMSLDFFVKKGVLIPRCDTEILVEEVLGNIREIERPRVVDVGCGSGAISVSIARYKEDAEVYALDINEIPLEVTEINRNKNGVSDRVRVIKSDILGGMPENLENSIDVIVSNPPYIREEVIPELMREVRDFEPHCALSGGIDGLYFYREITRQSIKFLKKDGLLAYEIGHDQREEVMDILIRNGFYDVRCIKDLAEHDRVVLGRRG